MNEEDKKINSVKGMNDILPPESEIWQFFYAKVQKIMSVYSYKFISTPIVEPTELFVRGLGEVTDIVEKEMYSFEDKLNGENLTLRPEGTAGIVRSVIENNLTYNGGKRLFYLGQMFRHERPQRGRYRQFHQVGVEAIGFAGAEVDAEVILLAFHIFKELEISDFHLELNTLGQLEERKIHRQKLIEYFEKYKNILDDDAKRRIYTNPLRVLDSKNPNLQEMINEAPKLITYLSDNSKKHLDYVQNILAENNIKWTINPRLVRGMDYYNLTVFEFITDKLGSQGTICGGGRYDYLMSQIGGKETPAVGWAMGVERIIELLKELNLVNNQNKLSAYAIIEDINLFPKAIKIIQSLRENNISIQMQTLNKENEKNNELKLSSIKSQFKKADNSKAKFALIFSNQEFNQNLIAIKSLRDGKGEQKTFDLNKDFNQLINYLHI